MQTAPHVSTPSSLFATGTVEEFYDYSRHAPHASSPHLQRLRDYARGVRARVAVECGTKRGASAAALLLGAASVISLDPVGTSEAAHLQTLVEPGRWDYRRVSSLTASVPEHDVLFIDSLHTYAQCRGELSRHADQCRRLLIFHDTLTFGSVGADGESGRQSWNHAAHAGESVPWEHMGIRPAIDQLMIQDPSWHIRAHHLDSHGLLVLERR